MSQQEMQFLEQFLALKEQEPLHLDPKRTALIVVDMQRYFVRPDYALARTMEGLLPGMAAGYFERVERTVVPSIRKLLSQARQVRMPVFFTATGSHTDDGSDMPGWMRAIDALGQAVVKQRVYPKAGDPSYAIDQSVAPLPGELVVHKAASGPLASIRLDQMLRNMEINSLVVCGLLTDVCVTQTARELADRGFQVVIAEDACTSTVEEQHIFALRSFHMTFGRVKTTAQLMDLLARQAPVAVSGS